MTNQKEDLNSENKKLERKEAIHMGKNTWPGQQQKSLDYDEYNLMNPIESEREDEAGDMVDLDRVVAVGRLREKDP